DEHDEIPLRDMMLPLAVPVARSQPCLLARRSAGVGTAAQSGARRLIRSVADRRVQGLGSRPRAVQAQPVSSVGTGARAYCWMAQRCAICAKNACARRSSSSAERSSLRVAIVQE